METVSRIRYPGDKVSRVTPTAPVWTGPAQTPNQTSAGESRSVALVPRSEASLWPALRSPNQPRVAPQAMITPAAIHLRFEYAMHRSLARLGPVRAVVALLWVRSPPYHSGLWPKNS